MYDGRMTTQTELTIAQKVVVTIAILGESILTLLFAVDYMDKRNVCKAYDFWHRCIQYMDPSVGRTLLMWAAATTVLLIVTLPIYLVWGVTSKSNIRR